MLLLSLFVLMVGLATVSAAYSDSSVATDNSGSDVATDSNSVTTAQATDSSTHTDSSVDKTSDTSTTSSQKSDVTSQQTTQKVSEKTSENTQTISDTTSKASSDTTDKASSDTSSQSTQSSNQSTQQVQSDSNTTNENTNTVNENVVDNSKSISTEDNTTSELAQTFTITSSNIGGVQNIIDNQATDGDTLDFRGDFSKVNMTVNKNLTLTSGSSASFVNSTINLVEGSSGSTISNLFINNTPTYSQIEILVIDPGVDHLNIINNTFIIYTASQTGRAITLNNSNYTTISRNNITVCSVVNKVDYSYDPPYEGTVDTYAIGVFNSSYVNVTENILNVSNRVRSSEPFATLTAIAVQGSVANDVLAHDILISSNDITVENPQYKYGITLLYNTQNINITNNNIYGSEVCNYSCAIELSTYVDNTLISGNNFNMSARNITFDIAVMGSGAQFITNTVITDNNMYGSANNSKAIELYFTNNTSVNGNEILIYGFYAEGVGMGGTINTVVTNNNITDKGTLSTESTTYDDIPFITAGIYVVSGDSYVNENLTVHQDSEYNNITENNVYCYGEYAINLTGNYNNINNNYVTSNVYDGPILTGNASILVSGTGNNCSDNTASTLTGRTDEELEETSTFIVTQDNYKDFFLESTSDDHTYQVTSGGLSDLVNDGDTLDIQGNITLEYKIAIDKAVNLTSSTNDGMFIGNTDRMRLTITESGSNTNVTNVKFYNTEFFTTGAENLTIDHINMTTIGIELGQNTGVFCMRSNSTDINVTNSYFYTEGNGGHSTLVAAGANHIVIDNCTIQGVGEVGNLVYLTTFDTEAGAVNGYTNVTNNVIIGPEEAQAVCRAVTLSGSNLYIANNFINYTGAGIEGQFVSDTEDDKVNSTYVVNNTVIGSGMILSGAEIVNNTADHITNTNGNVINNTIVYSLSVTGDNMTVTGNSLTAENATLYINTTNSLIENNAISGNNITITINGTNNTVNLNTDSDATIEGNLTLNIYKDSNSISNLNIRNQSVLNINGSNNSISNITIGEDTLININGSENNINNFTIEEDALININGSENIISNVTADGSSNVEINGDNNVITNNSFVKTTVSLQKIEVSQYVVTLNGTNNTVTYNNLIAYDLYNSIVYNGDDAVSNSENNIVHDNYGNGTIPEPNYMIYEVTSFEELKQVLDNIKANETLTSDEIVLINFKEGEYIATESLAWNESAGTIKSIVFNGTDQVITAQDLTLFITVGEGYSLEMNNLTLKDFNSTNDTDTLVNNGTLFISNSTFDNIGSITSSADSTITIKGSTFKNINYYGNFIVINSPAEIIDNTFQDSTITNDYCNFITLGGNYTIVGNNIFENISPTSFLVSYSNTNGEFIFENNTINNSKEVPINVNRIKTGYIRNNTFSNVEGGRSTIRFSSGSTLYIYNNTFLNNNMTEFLVLSAGNISYIYDNLFMNCNGDISISRNGSLINNTFINITGFSLSLNRPSSCEIESNLYINCSLPVNITGVSDANVTTDDFTATVTITTDSLYNMTVNEGQIIIYINGTEYKSFDVTDGQATITIEKSALGVLENTIEVVYVANDKSFANSSQNFTLTVDEGISININQTTIYSGDTISIPVQVAVNGSIVKDGSVILKVNGKTVRDEDGNPIMVKVDENGNAVFNYTIPDTNSNEYNISVVYSGSEGIVRSSRTITTSLKTASITVDQITAKAGQTVTLRAYITDQNGNAVSSGKLIFKLNGKTLKDANGNTLYATIVNGVATLNYTIPDNYSAKDYVLSAVYQGTGFERSEANSTLTLTKSTPTIIPDSTVFGTNNTITINQGTESVNIKATIIDPETNAPIDTTTVVTIKINDKTVTQQYVSNGQIDMTIYTSSFKNPEYNITVVVGENSQYERTSFNGTLIVNPMNSLANETSYNGTLLVKED